MDKLEEIENNIDQLSLEARDLDIRLTKLEDKRDEREK